MVDSTSDNAIISNTDALDYTDLNQKDSAADTYYRNMVALMKLR